MCIIQEQWMFKGKNKQSHYFVAFSLQKIQKYRNLSPKYLLHPLKMYLLFMDMMSIHEMNGRLVCVNGN